MQGPPVENLIDKERRSATIAAQKTESTLKTCIRKRSTLSRILEAIDRALLNIDDIQSLEGLHNIQILKSAVRDKLHELMMSNYSKDRSLSFMRRCAQYCGWL